MDVNTRIKLLLGEKDVIIAQQNAQIDELRAKIEELEKRLQNPDTKSADHASL